MARLNALLIILSLLVTVECYRNREIQIVSKEGRCPDVSDGQVGICAITCDNDLSCDNERKCCGNGCGGYDCMQPIEERMCHIPCPRIYEPVCGSDGQTYSSECMLNFTTCSRNQEFVHRVHDGTCQERDLNRGSEALLRGTCESRRKEAEKKPMIGAQVPQCDSDGNYEAMQCWGSVGMCWCVDEQGEKLSEPERGTLSAEHCQKLRNKLENSP
ncbi:U20-hexatoxin-Hi1a-like [Antedon mediterranea]|uniref:U20-hexatoxin-Hi1a-like n=1 Tax=Antedon mediterranea TaxID=105859 RepID=UPI003AF51D33